MQAPNTAWMTFADESDVPDGSVYIGPFKSSRPSYQSDLMLLDPTSNDQAVAHALEPYQNTFYTLYFKSPYAFGAEDRYTLFYPLSSPILDQLQTIYSNASLGFSYKDRKYKTDSASKIETLLKRHMIPIQINPAQLEYRNTRLTTFNDETFDINEKGFIHSDNQIRSYIKLPHATIFFIDKEIIY